MPLPKFPFGRKSIPNLSASNTQPEQPVLPIPSSRRTAPPGLASPSPPSAPPEPDTTALPTPPTTPPSLASTGDPITRTNSASDSNGFPSALVQSPTEYSTPPRSAPPTQPLSPETPGLTIDPISSSNSAASGEEAEAWPTSEVLTKWKDTINGFQRAKPSRADNAATTAGNISGPILNEILPPTMDILEQVVVAFPIVNAAFTPFKYIYHQDLKRKENNRRRNLLLERMKDAILVFTVLSPPRLAHVQKDLSSQQRLKETCLLMKDDFVQCQQVIEMQEQSSLAMRYVLARKWSDELTDFTERFKQHRDSILACLQMTAILAIDETQKRTATRDEMRKLFEEYTPKELEMGRWIQQNGGIETILKSQHKMRELVRKEASLASIPALTATEDDRIAALQKEYHEDIKMTLQQTWAAYDAKFQRRLDDFQERLQDMTHLTEEVSNKVDRVENFMKAGPHNRIHNKILRQVWMEQGFRGSAKTRSFVHALRDYLMDRFERHQRQTAGVTPVTPLTPLPLEEIGPLLQDGWIMTHVPQKSLHRLQQVFDRDMSGFTTIAEVNAFVRACPKDWSLPRWMSYWAVGWNVIAIKHCREIEHILSQMSLVLPQLGIHMPGNKRLATAYLSPIIRYVTALTTTIDDSRIESVPAVLVDQYDEYVKLQEDRLKKKLLRMDYTIESDDDLDELLRHDYIEDLIFILLKLLLRRHLVKFHLCLREDFNAAELAADATNVRFVVVAAWTRYRSLVEILSPDRTDLSHLFSRFSCGLFRNYWEWKRFDNTSCSQRPLSLVRSLEELDRSELEDILAHPAALSQDGRKLDKAATLEKDKFSGFLLGKWYGFRWETGIDRYSPMLCYELVSFQLSDPSESTARFSGFDHTEPAGTIQGDITKSTVTSERYTIKFQLFAATGSVLFFEGTLYPEKDIVYGTAWDNYFAGLLFLQRTANPRALILRPVDNVFLTPKQLWRYAIGNVVEAMKRDRLKFSNASYSQRTPPTILPMKNYEWVYKRMVLIKRAVLHCLTGDGSGLEPKAFRSFTPNEYREIEKLVSWYSTELHGNVRCDACGEYLTSPRVLCCTCLLNGVNETFDFCSSPECFLLPSVTRGVVTHEAGHVLLKSRDAVLPQNLTVFAYQAVNRLQSAQSLWNQTLSSVSEESSVSRSETEAQDPDSGLAFKCVYCNEKVIAPFWCCFDCPDNCFVCDSCEDELDRMLPWDLQKVYRAQIAFDSSLPDLLRKAWLSQSSRQPTATKYIQRAYFLQQSNERLTHTVYHKLVRFPQSEASNQTDNVPDQEMPAQIKEVKTELAQLRDDLRQSSEETNMRIAALEQRLAKVLENLELLTSRLGA